MKDNLIQVDEKTIRTWLIQSIRYSIPRDNHLAPSGVAMEIEKYLPLFVDKEYAAQKFIDEIKTGIQYHTDFKGQALQHQYVWNNLVEYLRQYI